MPFSVLLPWVSSDQNLFALRFERTLESSRIYGKEVEREFVIVGVIIFACMTEVARSLGMSGELFAFLLKFFQTRVKKKIA